MVSFICGACGNTVKKAQVEKHYSTVCRSCSVLSCLDCGVDFPGNSYLGHTSCVTEAEKYQGHLYQPKEKGNKGETKQKEWLKNVHGTTASSTNDPKLKGLLKRLSAYSNIPRKKKKFENFCKNSVNVYDSKTLDQLWDLFNVSSVKESKNINEESKTECEESNTSELSDDNKSIENGDTIDIVSQIETISNGDASNDDDASNENEGLVTKKKKKKKKKHIENGECNGESLATQTDSSQTSRLKKKTKKHAQVNAENINEDQVTQGKKKKKSKKECLTGEIDKSSEICGETKHSKTKKEGKKRKVKEETVIDAEDAEVIKGKKMKKELNGQVSEDNEKENVEEDVEVPQGKFNWHKAIKTVLKESEDHELSVKKLRKKVLNAYQEHGIDHRAPTMDESRAMFDKKLKSYPKVKLLKDNVKLVK